MTPEEAKSKYLNVWKVTQELARCKHPEKVLSALAVIAAQEAWEAFPERFTGRTDLYFDLSASWVFRHLHRFSS